MQDGDTTAEKPYKNLIMGCLHSIFSSSDAKTPEKKSEQPDSESVVITRQPTGSKSVAGAVRNDDDLSLELYAEKDDLEADGRSLHMVEATAVRELAANTGSVAILGTTAKCKSAGSSGHSKAAAASTVERCVSLDTAHGRSPTKPSRRPIEQRYVEATAVRKLAADTGSIAILGTTADPKPADRGDGDAASLHYVEATAVRQLAAETGTIAILASTATGNRNNQPTERGVYETPLLDDIPYGVVEVLDAEPIDRVSLSSPPLDSSSEQLVPLPVLETERGKAYNFEPPPKQGSGHSENPKKPCSLEFEKCRVSNRSATFECTSKDAGHHERLLERTKMTTVGWANEKPQTPNSGESAEWSITRNPFLRQLGNELSEQTDDNEGNKFDEEDEEEEEEEEDIDKVLAHCLPIECIPKVPIFAKCPPAKAKSLPAKEAVSFENEVSSNGQPSIIRGSSLPPQTDTYEEKELTSAGSINNDEKNICDVESIKIGENTQQLSDDDDVIESAVDKSKEKILEQKSFDDTSNTANEKDTVDKSHSEKFSEKPLDNNSAENVTNEKSVNLEQNINGGEIVVEKLVDKITDEKNVIDKSLGSVKDKFSEKPLENNIDKSVTSDNSMNLAQTMIFGETIIEKSVHITTAEKNGVEEKVGSGIDEFSEKPLENNIESSVTNDESVNLAKNIIAGEIISEKSVDKTTDETNVIKKIVDTSSIEKQGGNNIKKKLNDNTSNKSSDEKPVDNKLNEKNDNEKPISIQSTEKPNEKNAEKTSDNKLADNKSSEEKSAQKSGNKNVNENDIIEKSNGERSVEKPSETNITTSKIKFNALTDAEKEEYRLTMIESVREAVNNIFSAAVQAAEEIKSRQGSSRSNFSLPGLNRETRRDGPIKKSPSDGDNQEVDESETVDCVSSEFSLPPLPNVADSATSVQDPPWPPPPPLSEADEERTIAPELSFDLPDPPTEMDQMDSEISKLDISEKTTDLPLDVGDKTDNKVENEKAEMKANTTEAIGDGSAGAERAVEPRNDGADDRAATTIQAMYRGFRARKYVETVNAAAAKIQAGFRGYRVRQSLKNASPSTATTTTDDSQCWSDDDQKSVVSVTYVPLKEQGQAPPHVEQQHQHQQHQQPQNNGEDDIGETGDDEVFEPVAEPVLVETVVASTTDGGQDADEQARTDAAVVKIQARVRGFVTRNRLNKQKNDEEKK